MSRQSETDGSRYAAFRRDEIIVAILVNAEKTRKRDAEKTRK